MSTDPSSAYRAFSRVTSSTNGKSPAWAGLPVAVSQPMMNDRSSRHYLLQLRDALREWGDQPSGLCQLIVGPALVDARLVLLDFL